MSETAKAARPMARTLEGTVVSTSMEKTAVVAVKRRVKHTRYHKFIERSRKYMVHDEHNVCRVGDRVLIAEARPMSLRKRWRLNRVLERAVADVVEIADALVEE